MLAVLLRIVQTLRMSATTEANESRLRLAFKKQMFQSQFQNSTLVPGITQQ